MLRYISFDIVFQEIPGEITLAINISNCPNRCKSCHSPHLRENTGETLDENAIAALLDKYGKAITCICFMGGDAEPRKVERLAAFVRTAAGRKIKTGWYSGRAALPDDVSLLSFDYIKLGEYIEHLGGLNAHTTNQRFYSIENGTMTDITDMFWNKVYNKKK
ncbi:MAG: anaerobic ribonucleoside-triphosphate reductase activating protein [Prevotellaceae bacterium]|jgi:anaerobic ribonucleoside-triphosphate reductase activating protein|nr:anaerobic ribonucleoside-triphosphate reductase activating protein [Prevotellaceae bacterium]